jgi:hypothetical protein
MKSHYYITSITEQVCYSGDISDLSLVRNSAGTPIILRVFELFFSPSSKRYYATLKLVHDHFLPHSFQFNIR